MSGSSARISFHSRRPPGPLAHPRALGQVDGVERRQRPPGQQRGQVPAGHAAAPPPPPPWPVAASTVGATSRALTRSRHGPPGPPPVREAQQQGDAHVGLVQPVVVEPAAVLVQLLAVVGAEHHQGVLPAAQLRQALEDVGQAGVGVGDAGVVLGGDVVDVRHPGQPLREVVGEPGRAPDRVHAALRRIAARRPRRTGGGRAPAAGTACAGPSSGGRGRRAARRACGLVQQGRRPGGDLLAVAPGARRRRGPSAGRAS